MIPLERVARVICGELGVEPDETVVTDGEPRPAWTGYIGFADAVIQALREPSEQMAQTGAEIVQNVRSTESAEAYANDAANTWRYMIDAARDWSAADLNG